MKASFSLLDKNVQYGKDSVGKHEWQGKTCISLTSLQILFVAKMIHDCTFFIRTSKDYLHS